MNPISVYTDAGDKAGRAQRNGDIALRRHWKRWVDAALALEKPPYREHARQAFVDAYIAKAGTVKNPKARDPAHRALLKKLDTHFARDERATPKRRRKTLLERARQVGSNMVIAYHGKVYRTNDILNPTKNPKRDPIGTVDQHGARDLYWSIESYRELHPQKMAIIKNLLIKKSKGTYNIALAKKLWRYWIDNGAKQYARENGVRFNVPTRDRAAEMVTETEDAKMNGGEYGHVSLKRGVQSNPAKLERCVRAVKKRGGAVNAYAVCNANIRRKRRRNPFVTYRDGYVVKARRGHGTVLTWTGTKFSNREKPFVFATPETAVRAGQILYSKHKVLLKHYRLWVDHVGGTARP